MNPQEHLLFLAQYCLETIAIVTLDIDVNPLSRSKHSKQLCIAASLLQSVF